MKQDIAMLSGYIFLFCLIVFITSVITLVVARATKNDEMLKASSKVMLGSLLLGMVGFGVCSALFELHIE